MIYLYAQVCLCGLGHYFQDPEAHICSCPLTALGLIIHTLPAVQVNRLLELWSCQQTIHESQIFVHS